MKIVRYQATPVRIAAAILAGLLAAVVAAQLHVWAALSALGVEDWFQQLLSHLQTKALDFGPSFVLAVLAWIVFDRLGLRDAKYAVLVGGVSFYLAPRLYALLYLTQVPYWSFDRLPALFVPRFSEIVIGAVLSFLMWAIAYWKPSSAATIVQGNGG